MMGIHPDQRDAGIGFALKRAQWQMVRHQGLDHITWTYDPLLSRNAYLNIAKLGAVCNTYRRSEYGDMRDGLNAGLPSDRFQVDWWIHTHRVEVRLGKRARRPLKLDHFSKADLQPLYSLEISTQAGDWPRPPEHFSPLEGKLALAEIPFDFGALKDADFSLARDWRFFSRELFETAFAEGYIVTDFVRGRIPWLLCACEWRKHFGTIVSALRLCSDLRCSSVNKLEYKYATRSVAYLFDWMFLSEEVKMLTGNYLRDRFTSAWNYFHYAPARSCQQGDK